MVDVADVGDAPDVGDVADVVPPAAGPVDGGPVVHDLVVRVVHDLVVAARVTYRRGAVEDCTASPTVPTHD